MSKSNLELIPLKYEKRSIGSMLLPLGLNNRIYLNNDPTLPACLFTRCSFFIHDNGFGPNLMLQSVLKHAVENAN